MRVLISRPDKIGDVILALHGIKQIKKLCPEFEVFIHVSDYALDLAKKVKFLDGCVRLGEDITKFKFDAVVDLMAKSKQALNYYRAGIPLRIGNRARWFSFLYTRSAIVRRSYAKVNEAEYNWRLMSLLDYRLEGSLLKYSLSGDDFIQSVSHRSNGSKTLVVMPGVSVSAAPWDESKWGEFLRIASERQEWQIIVLGGPAEKELLARMQSSIATLPNVQYEYCTNFDSVFSILRSAQYYVGPSTGITHLASIFGLRGVALYPVNRSMHPRRWRPFDGPLRVQLMYPQLSALQVFQAFEREIVGMHKLGARSPLSAFIICCNEEEKIGRALESIKWADEILVIDSGSKDNTIEIAKSYGARVIQRHWPGHTAQKQFALEQCSHEWVLNIDADEEVSNELRERIEKILDRGFSDVEPTVGYNLSRIVWFFDRWWNRGGWYPEYRLRLFQKSYTRWGGVDPHEKALSYGVTKNISEPLYHYTYSDLAGEIDSLNKMSARSALCFFKQGHRARVWNLVLNPLMRFIKFYLFKMGFREGRAGFIVACNEAFYTYMKYSKMWELEENKRISSKISHRPVNESAAESSVGRIKSVG